MKLILYLESWVPENENGIEYGPRLIFKKYALEQNWGDVFYRMVEHSERAFIVKNGKAHVLKGKVTAEEISWIIINN